jgi:hypothetical protein
MLTYNKQGIFEVILWCSGVEQMCLGCRPDLGFRPSHERHTSRFLSARFCTSIILGQIIMTLPLDPDSRPMECSALSGSRHHPS